MLISLSAQVGTMLEQPQAGPPLLETLVRWFDPRADANYHSDAVADSQGFAGGLAELSEPEAHRQLLMSQPR